MFDSISIMPNNIRELPIDIGDIAERMFYYKQVHVFVGEQELTELFKFADVDLIVEYIKRGSLKIHSKKKHYGVMTRDDVGPNIFTADFLYKQNYDLKETIYNAYYKLSQDKEKSKAVASKLYNYVGIYDAPSGFAKQVDVELKDSEFLRAAIYENMRYYLPHEEVSLENLIFEIERIDEQFIKVDSNIDINKYPYLDPASVILNIGTAIDKIKIVGNYNTEISCPELDSRIISAKFNSIIKKSTKAEKELDVFKHAVYDKAPSIKQVINSKERSLEEFLSLLDVADKFKGWLENLDENDNVINEYLASIGEKTWIQSTKSKSIRFYLTQGLSTILKATGSSKGIVAGIALSAFNTFLLEKLVKKWKPNQFVEDELHTFLEKDKS